MLYSPSCGSSVVAEINYVKYLANEYSFLIKTSLIVWVLG